MEETHEDNESKEIIDKKQNNKKIRKRTKALFKNIKNQMEFYFSDSNLQKDRFIKQETDKNINGYVDLCLFTKFNKIKMLTDDLSIISKAVSKSDKLQLNEDGTKVKRIKPFVELDLADIDARTVYVECLPRTVDHDWMEKVFSEVGAINYISLPKFKSTGDPKGFGFVEFDSQQSAAKACELLNNPPVELGTRAGKFPKSNKQLEQLKKHGATEEMMSESEITANKVDITLSKQRKRGHRTTSESSIDGLDVSGAKRVKHSSIEPETLADGKEEKRKSLEGNMKSDEEGSATKQKKKKKKKKSRRSQDTSKTDEESEVTDSNYSNKTSCHDDNKTSQTRLDCKADVLIPSTDKQVDNQLQVTVKSETGSVDMDKSKKRKRASFEEVKGGCLSDSCDTSPQKRKRKLEVSADASSESDQIADIQPKKKSRNSVEFSEPVVQNVVTIQEAKKKRRRKKKKDAKEAETLHLRVLPKTEWLNLRKNYLKIQKSNMSELKKKLLWQQKENKPDVKTTNAKGDNKHKLIEFIADVIVKVESQTPLDKKQLREMFSSDVKIAYVDVTDGKTSGFIRCQDAQSAIFVASSNIDYYRFHIIAGDEESDYWKKLESDRETKLNNKSRPKKRGAHKLVEKAQKINAHRLDKNHLFFED